MLSDHLSPTNARSLSRRNFLAQAILSGSAAVLGTQALAGSERQQKCPVAVFSKVYQELKFNFAEAAAITSEAGLEGVDCPVRDGGEITPEAAVDQLPRYAELLAARNSRVWLLTTGITSIKSAHAEDILRTAKSLGIRYYRVGFIHREPARAEQQMREVRAHLKELAALNRQLGLCALLQNHSPAGGITYFGGDLGDLQQAVDGFDPQQVGVAFDIGHALIVHGDRWREYFQRLRPHFRIAYVKDVQRGRGWVLFGQGEIGATGYFQLLKEMGYHEPVSLHIEFDWTDEGRHKTKAALVQALRQSSTVLRQWLT